MKIRISQTTLPGDYQDGQVLYGADVNKIINLLREGVNNNFDDYIKIVAGGRTVYTFNQIADMNDAAEELGGSDEGAIAIVFDYSEGDNPEVIALDVYEFDGTEFVSYTDTPVSFLDVLDAVDSITGNATAGAAHAAITNGSNPHATTFANIAAKPTTIAGYGITDNLATLVGGTVPAAQLPSYVDDVIEGVWINSTTFTVGGNAVTGETGKIYVSTSGTETHKTFRYTGSQFVEISVSLGLGNTSGTAFRGDFGEQALNNATLAAGWGNHATVGYLTASSTAVTNISNNVANLQGGLNNLTNTVNNTNNLVNTINGSYLTASSTTITNISNNVANLQTDLGNLTNVVTNTVESDPVFTASNAFDITSTDKGNWNNAYGWGNHQAAGYANGSNVSNWDTAFSWGNHANGGYVVNTRTIANIALSNNITAANLTAELPVATNIAKGLMSSTDKTNLDAIQALMGSDENSIVDKITDVLDVFENYPEGTNIVTALNGKLNANFANIANWDSAFGWGNHANGGYALNTAITNAGNWDTAFGWGNHASVGYLTTETDPTVPSDVKNITSNDIGNWNNAYAWGNHASVGYLTNEADTLDSVVNRGSVTNNATINYITTTRTDFNTTATDGYTTGQVGWDADSGTLSVGLLNGTTTKVGQQTMFYVQADETLTTGDVVQFNGVAGFKPKVKKAVQSEINNMPSLLMGVVTGNIGTGNLGYVTSFGLVRNINTANFGNEGQILYYDSNTSNAAGKTTTTVPTAPNAKIELASVVREATGGSSNGELLIRVGTAVSLAFDSSVQLSSPTTGEVLGYNGTSGRWENVEVSSLGINVALTNVQNGQTFIYDDGIWRNQDLTVYGSVNSVGLNMPTGFTVANSPITNSGTLGVTYTEGYSLPATATQDNWNSAFGWGNHQAVGYIVGLANATVTDGNIASWNGTTGKLLKDTGVAISSIGNVVGAGTVLSGNVATYNGTTGALLGVGYTVETTLTNTVTAIPVSSAVITYVDNAINNVSGGSELTVEYYKYKPSIDVGGPDNRAVFAVNNAIFLGGNNGYVYYSNGARLAKYHENNLSFVGSVAAGTGVTSEAAVTASANLIAFSNDVLYLINIGGTTLSRFYESNLVSAGANVAFTGNSPRGIAAYNGFIYLATNQTTLFKISEVDFSNTTNAQNRANVDGPSIFFHNDILHTSNVSRILTWETPFNLAVAPTALGATMTNLRRISIDTVDNTIYTTANVNGGSYYTNGTTRKIIGNSNLFFGEMNTPITPKTVGSILAYNGVIYGGQYVKDDATVLRTYDANFIQVSAVAGVSPVEARHLYNGYIYTDDLVKYKLNSPYVTVNGVKIGV